MTAPLPYATRSPDWSIRPILPGLILAVLTLLLGFGLGVVFGLNEDAIKDRLTASAASAPASAYQGDEAKIKAVLDKSWVYMQRSHLHAGALGAVAVALSLVLLLLGTPPVQARVISTSLGAGSLGYSGFWLWAGFRAPGLGGTGAAKESLSWLAIPSSGLVVAGTFGVLMLLALALWRPARQRQVIATPALVPVS